MTAYIGTWGVYALLLLLLHVPISRAQLQSAGWCAAGMSMPNFLADHGVPSVDVIVAQAPIFSNNPSIGKKLGWFNLYHTALVLSQRIPEGRVRNWTVEFDSVHDVLGGILPQVDGNSLSWDNDARFCVTSGVLWGEAHWSKIFEVVTSLTAQQAQKLFTDFVLPMNRTQPHTRPMYQLWKVVDRQKPEHTLIGDITCGQGTSWMLHFASTNLGAQLRADFKLKYTSMVMPADRIDAVKTNDPAEWAKVLKYYDEMVQVAARGQSTLQKLEDLWSLKPVKYVYDSNAKTYCEVVGNRFPWLEVRYEEYAPEGPPWASSTSLRVEAPEALSLMV